MRLLASLCALAVTVSSAAWAQVELVDPDARPSKGKKSPELRALDPDAEPDPEDAEAPPEVDSDPTGSELSGLAGKAVAPTGTKPAAPKAPVKAEPKKDPERPAPPAILCTQVTSADFAEAWATWKKAAQSKDFKGEEAARAALLRLKARAGVSDLELYAIGLLRAAGEASAAGDSGAAVPMAVTATELAPALPASWSGLARAYFQADPTEIGRYVSALSQAVSRTFKDPRYLRPALAQLAALLVLALVGTALAVVAVLFLRRVRYFLHDFHYFFPRAAARWQTSALALLLLALPVVFRLGLVPVLLTLFAAVTLYLSTSERVVAVALIGLLGVLPVVGERVVQATAFADTPAEDLYRIERGGPSAQALVDRYEDLAKADKAGFIEHAVLGHFYVRRGQLDLAASHLRQALALRPDDLGAKVNMAATLFFGGDLENSRAVLQDAQKSDDALVLFNLGRIYKRRLAVYGDAVASEVDKANALLARAAALDPTLPPLGTEELTQPTTGNEYLRTAPVSRADLLSLAKSSAPAERVRSQLTQLLMGDVPAGVATFLPLALALLVLGIGFLGPTLEAAKVCARCGRPASRREDPELSPGSLMCAQCVNVFVNKNMVAPSLKMRKQAEIARYEARVERLSYGLGLVWSGMGHVFAGWPVRGSLYGFFFVLAVVAVVLRHGLVRAPYDPMPMAVWLAPLGLSLLLLYVLTLRGLRRRQR